MRKLHQHKKENARLKDEVDSASRKRPQLNKAVREQRGSGMYRKQSRLDWDCLAISLGRRIVIRWLICNSVAYVELLIFAVFASSMQESSR